MPRILIIDDDRDMRVALRMMLEHEGHRVREASNGEEGLLIFSQDPTDLVITDVMMPEKDGMETMLALKSDYPDVKIIVMSGKDKESLPIAEEFGAAYTLFKPFRQSELVKALNAAFGEED